MNQGTMDLTQGRPVTQLLRFSLPLVLGTLFQQLYSFVDTVMVGRLISEKALAAVGTTYSLSFLTLGFLQGACVGFGIPLAQATGAKDTEEFKRYFWNGIWMCLVLAMTMTAGTLLFADPLLKAIHTPRSIFSEASQYIKIIFLGIPAAILYNFCASALRASGDSKRPTLFLLFSSLLNIILDYIFIVPIPMGVAGAALATVLSQLISGLLNLGWLLWNTPLLKESTGLRRLSSRHTARLCILGIPMGFEYSVSALGAVLMQGAINTLGTAAIAGQATGEKIRQMFTLPMESVGMGMATYAGQNHGARRYDRIQEGIRAGILIQLCYSIAAWVIIFFGKGFFTEIILGSGGGKAAQLSIEYLGSISTLFFLLGCLMIMRNVLQGMGYSIHAVLSGGGELLGRSLFGWLAAVYWGFPLICYANPAAWGLALLYCSVMVFFFLHPHLKSHH